MAKKPSSTKSKKKPNSRAIKVTTSKRSRSTLSRGKLALVVALLFGSAGVYTLVQSGALQPDEALLPDQPERGLVYHGKKVKTKGPCEGGFDVTTEEDVKRNEKEGKNSRENRRCAHYDPTPLGVDLRERVKKVDQNLAALAAHDEKNKPAASDDETSGYEQQPVTAATIWAGDMDGIGARDWPCFGTGAGNARIQLIYVYPSGGTNRLNTLRPGFSAIAKRMNSIFYHSGAESGNAHQIRFATNNGEPGCDLRIAAEPIRGDQLNDFSFIRAELADRGYKGVPEKVDLDGDGVLDWTVYENRKYLIWVDKDTENCGLGELRTDASPGQNNTNNTSVTYAMAWKGCWNYAEPHELMHMLGGVQGKKFDSDGNVIRIGAPYSTPGGHCYDERDVMCYDDDVYKRNANGDLVDSDGVKVVIQNRCTRDIDWWRFDCKHDTYYRGNDPADGWLSNHWNTANSKYLTP
jgi:hypothetical protein